MDKGKVRASMETQCEAGRACCGGKLKDFAETHTHLRMAMRFCSSSGEYTWMFSSMMARTFSWKSMLSCSMPRRLQGKGKKRGRK